MEIEELLAQLNEEQLNAVVSDAKNNLVLAGAGSGKTRVLVYRIARHLLADGLRPSQLLAVTFTNKAAREMRQRVEQIMNCSMSSSWIGTFHGISHRILRINYAEAGLPSSFQVMDSSDQRQLIKKIITDLGMKTKDIEPGVVATYINNKKEEGIRAESVVYDSCDPYAEINLEIYKKYQSRCRNLGLVDFAELLLKTLELLRDNATILQNYRNRFKSILVDEFQDTNAIQYALIRLLATDNTRVFVVGDDDQSIYGWRGARVDNVFDFSKDFADTNTFRLEQNYRSSANILEAANELISKNSKRMGKNLWTDDSKGMPLYLHSAENGFEEAVFVVEKIKQLVVNGEERKNIALLYRSNFLSRLFENELVRWNIPYSIYGGLRFFDRAEIKDSLAYLRLVNYRGDDAAFERIINQPSRGIGKTTQEKIAAFAVGNNLSLWDAAVSMANDKQLGARATNAISAFVKMIEETAIEISLLELSDKIEKVIEKSGLLAHYQKDQSETGISKVDNLKELVSAAKGYFYDNDDEVMTPENQLSMFLTEAVLDAGDSDTDENTVQLMTIHSAKGLEFDNVFIVGMDQGVFPSQRSIDENPEIEEERRLCYVAITRARRQVYLTRADSRMVFGSPAFYRESQFIEEIPQTLIEEIGIAVKTGSYSSVRDDFISNNIDGNECLFRSGVAVIHPKFGVGVIVDTEGAAANLRLHIEFEEHGLKVLIAKFAKLEVV
ncbi:MAG: DNA helicase II [Gammaproteobacteria bacterium]|nr:MAG: DNA helicase II [Gammaproteobacteria bacterium]